MNESEEVARDLMNVEEICNNTKDAIKEFSDMKLKKKYGNYENLVYCLEADWYELKDIQKQYPTSPCIKEKIESMKRASKTVLPEGTYEELYK